MSDASPAPSETAAPRWRTLSAIDRRVLGVLVEKAKTVPESYPMTVNGIVTGANQKSNRAPILNVTPDAIEASLERLRGFGVVTEVWGSGRVAKYRHHMKEWMGVEKFEAAVMTELLLRGTQTEGELRQRASRMDEIPDLGALKEVLRALQAKNLVVSITPEGRGHVVTHNLYEPRELDKVKSQFAAIGASALAADEEDSAEEASTEADSNQRTKPWQIEVDALKADVAALRDELQRLRESLGA